MKNINSILEATILRQKAEARITRANKVRQGSPFQLPEADMLKLMHELNVHQIELELQNEELNRARSETKDISGKYFELTDLGPTGYLFLSKEGKILELNISGATMIGIERSRLLNSNLGFYITKETLPDFYAFIKKVFKSRTKESCKVILSSKSKLPRHVHLIGIVTENGEQCIVTMVDYTDIMKAEKSLISSETRYRRLFETSKDGILILDAETGIINDVNPYLIDLLGYSKEQFIEKAIWEISLFKDIAANKDKFLELQQKKYVRYEDLPLETADGQLINVEFVSNVYLVDNKKVIQCKIRNVSRRMKAEELLKSSEVRYRRLFEAAKDGILILDAETGMIRDVNPYLIEMLGYSKEQFINKEIWKIGFFKDVAANKDKFLELQQKKYVRYDDLPLKTEDGREINVEFVSNVYQEDHHPVIQCNIRDITKRKRGERNLFNKNREIEAQVELNVKVNKELVFQNEEKEKRAAELNIANKELHFQGEEKEKRAAELVIANEELRFQNEEKEKRAAELIIANKELLFQSKQKEMRAAELIIANKELRFQNKEKAKRAAELNIANKELAFQNEEKEKRAAELIAANKELVFQTKEREKRAAELTINNKELSFQNEEKEKRTAELSIALERAESSDRLKSIFLATMSHELRTPLNSIIGFSGILMQETPGPLNEEQKKQLGMVQFSGRHLLALINVILDLSRIESGELMANYESFNIMDVIEDVMKTVEPSVIDKGLSLSIVKKPKNGYILSEKQRVHQVLLNLVDNAIKFTEKGSVSIGCYKENGSLKIEVSDTGIGIKDEELGGIFNPFTQIDNTLTRKFEGSGLGLSISEKLMKLLHGKIDVKSEFGVGSTFTISLPSTAVNSLQML